MENKDKNSGKTGFEVSLLCRPGIYRLECLPLKRAYFGKSDDQTLYDLGRFYDKLVKGVCNNEQLLQDLRAYGEDNFFADIVITSVEFRDINKLNAALEKAKKEWPGELY